LINRSVKSNAVLLIYPSQLSLSRLAELTADLKLAFASSAKKVRPGNVISENEVLVFEMDDVVEGAAIATKRFGVEKVALARKLPNANFEQISSEIASVGKLKVLPQEKFFVKVKISKDANVNYEPIDLEFASTGDLISALMSRSTQFRSNKIWYPLPARNEIEADRTLEVYVGKRASYVCIETDKGLGGLPFGCQKEKVMCAFYDALSAISCVSMLKSGFLPEVIVLYTDDESLRQNLKMLGFVISKVNTRKYSLRLAKLNLPTAEMQSHSEISIGESKRKRQREREREKEIGIRSGRGSRESKREKAGLEQLQKMGYHEGILKRLAAIRILSQMNEKNIVLPFSTAVHSLWLIESVFNQITAQKKVPWMPLLLPIQDLDVIAEELGMNEFKPLVSSNEIINEAESGSTFTGLDHRRYSRIIDKVAEQAIKDMKFVSFEIGPNYLHNILDSI
jgi:hypothetical protein